MNSLPVISHRLYVAALGQPHAAAAQPPGVEDSLSVLQDASPPEPRVSAGAAGGNGETAKAPPRPPTSARRSRKPRASRARDGLKNFKRQAGQLFAPAQTVKWMPGEALSQDPAAIDLK